ncbi:MAG TPA: DUF2510 domain-containing protein [Pseudolysinimonas sp.]|nr:DUF2510 domain-containing protein [Pseudolysinimonas sp.]
MTDQAQAQATRVVSAGWYEDPASADLVRWWNGATWTDHTEPKPTTESIATSTYVPVVSGTFTGWFLAITPALLFVLGALAAYLFLYAASAPAAIAILVVLYAVVVAAAVLDARILRHRGFRSPRALWSLLGALPYLIARRLAVTGNTLLVVFLAIAVVLGGGVAGLLASGAAAPVTKAYFVQSTLNERLVDTGRLSSVSCPPILDDASVGADVTCDAVRPDGLRVQVLANLGANDTLTQSYRAN